MFFQGSKRFLHVLNREKKKELLACLVLSTIAILGCTAFSSSSTFGFLLANSDLLGHTAFLSSCTSGFLLANSDLLGHTAFLSSCTSGFLLANGDILENTAVLASCTSGFLLANGAILGHTAFLTSCTSGFLVAKCLGSKETGKRSKIPSVSFRLSNYKIHLHHWLISTVVMAWALFKGPLLLPSELFYGVLSGIAFQGIYCYADWHRIITSNRVRLPPLKHVGVCGHQKWDTLSSKLLDVSCVAGPVADSDMNDDLILSSDGI